MKNIIINLRSVLLFSFGEHACFIHDGSQEVIKII